MAAAVILKNQKNTIPLLIDRFWRNLARWCILALQNPSAN